MQIKVGGQKYMVKTFAAKFKDFDGDVKKWQAAYFDLLAWKNTWRIPLRMDMMAGPDHEAYLYLVIEDKKQTVEMVKNMLDDAGYRNVEVFDSEWMMLYPDYEDDVDEYMVG